MPRSSLEGGCSIVVTSKDLSHTQYHIKGFFLPLKKGKGSPVLEGPGVLPDS